MAIIIIAITPQLYRGYIYVPLGDNLCYYLGSRFYNPQLGRFLNADKHTDTGIGVNGTNMFAYCNNNPVIFTDYTGENSIAAEEDQPLGIPEFFLAIFVLFATILNFYNPTKVQVPSPNISISKTDAKTKADTKIRTKIKNKNQKGYWVADFSKDKTYVVISDEINYNTAKQRVAKGLNVFTVTKSMAYLLAKDAGKGKNPMYHNAHKNDIGYYPHYHMYGHSNSAHVWFLYNV